MIMLGSGGEGRGKEKRVTVQGICYHFPLFCDFTVYGSLDYVP